VICFCYASWYLHAVNAHAPTLKLPWLRALLATREARSMHGAARLLHRSQPSISLAIASLEARVGVQLLARGPAGTELTREGQCLAERATRGLEFMLRSAQGAGLGATPLARLRHQVRDSPLGALTAAVSAGAIAGAARQRGIAAPVVSRALAHLTHAVEQPLYRRAGNGIELTRAARELAAGYELLQSEVRQGLEELRELRGIYDGLLNVGALPTARASWLPRSLEALLEAHPDVSVTIMDGPYEEQLGALRQGRIDLIMGALRHPPPGGDLVQEAIFHDTLSLVCRSGHPLQRLRTGRGTAIDRRALAQHRWLLPPAGTPAREQWGRLLAARRLPRPARVIECNSFLTIRELLLHSDAIAVVPTSQVASDIVQSRLCILGPSLPQTRHEVGWTLRAGFRPTELLRAFLECSRASAQRAIPETHG